MQREGDEVEARSSGSWPVLAAVAVVAILVAWYALRPPGEPKPPPDTVTAGEPGRYAKARAEVSAVGPAEADIYGCLVWPIHADANNLMLFVKFGALGSEAAISDMVLNNPAYAPRMVGETSGKSCRRVTEAPIVREAAPPPGEAVLCFEMLGQDELSYRLELPFQVGGVKASFKFTVAVSDADKISDSAEDGRIRMKKDVFDRVNVGRRVALKRPGVPISADGRDAAERVRAAMRNNMTDDALPERRIK